MYNEIRDKLTKGANESADIATKAKEDTIKEVIKKTTKKSFSGNTILDEDKIRGKKYESTNEFRRIQEESRRESFESIKRQKNDTTNNEELRRRLSTNLQRELERRGYNSSTYNELVLKSKRGATFNIY